jgi:acetyl-CoA acetyltransferase family protein
MREAYIVGAVRTPVGKNKGDLSRIRPDDLAALSLNALVQRAGVDPVQIEDVVLGCVTQHREQGWNLARVAVLAAGWPIDVPGVSVNRMCGSSQQALHFAAQAVASGAHDLIVAAGVESMSRVPISSDGESVSDFVTEHYKMIPQGLSADLIADKWDLSRQEIDEFSLESHRKAVAAMDAGYFDREIAPVQTVDAEGKPVTVTRDQGPRRDTTLEKLAGLKPVFREGGKITAASSSQISDGAAAILVASEQKAQELGLRPRARIVAMSLAGVDPTIMLTGPIPATRKVLQKAGLKMQEMDLVEINEAFASVVLAWQKEMDFDPKKTNVNGGAIALGHPLGASGAKLMTTLLHELERQGLRYGLQTMCIGFGQGIATIIERV